MKLRNLPYLFFLLLFSCKSYNPGVSDESLTGGFVILVLITVFLGGGFLWLGLIVEPKEKKEREAQEKLWEIENQKRREYERKEFEELKKNKVIFDSHKILLKRINTLSEMTSPCNKCSEETYTVWELNKSTLTIRCNACKKKFVINNTKTEDGFVNSFFDAFTNYRKLLDMENEYTFELIDNDFNFINLKKNEPLCRGILFDATGGEVEEIEVEINQTRRISKQVQDRVWRRDEGKCQNCGSKEKLEFDHIIPFSKGGANTYRNIQLLCESCNRSKSDKIG